MTDASATYSQPGKPESATSVEVQQEGMVTSGWCRKTFGVTYNTAYSDLSDLVERGLFIQWGKGRATRYEINFERE